VRPDSRGNPRALRRRSKQEKEGQGVNTPINQLLMQKGRDIITIAPTATVFEAVQLMDAKNIGSLLVLNTRGKIAGIFAERDCFRKVILAGKAPQDVQVKAVMTKKVIYASPETTVDECMSLMTEKRIRHLPVLDHDEKILGIISIGDLVKFVVSEQDAMIKNLEKYIEGSL
jgi:IMP dehydrogenase